MRPIERQQVDTSARRTANDAPVPVLPGAAPEEPTLRDYVATVLEARWFIAGVVAAALALGCAYLVLATPRFESDALVQVEDKAKGGLFGQLDDLSGLLGSQTPADTEIEILRSRTLLGAVVDELKLDVVATPRFFPVVGRAVARWRSGDSDDASPWKLGRFAWGGERIVVPRLDVDRGLEGKALTLTAVGGGRYEVTGPAGLRLGGVVGQPARSEPNARGERVELFVSQLVAAEGVQFRIERVQRSKAIVALQRALAIGEQGRKTGVLRIALDGSDPAQIAATLDAIARTYLRQNVERKSAEAEKTLEFINSQLPVLKANLDAAEAALGAHRASRGSAVDLSLETKAVLDRATEIEKRAAELAFQRAELRQRFTDTHPAVAALRQKEGAIDAERSAINARLKVLPDAELSSVRLMRDVKVANELYVLLLNKAQELKVVKSGTVGNVRILDAAVVPTDPTSPKSVGAIGGALLFGLALGVAGAFVRKALDAAIDDPEQIERKIGIPCCGTIPHSEAEASSAAGRTRTVPLLAAAHPDDLAVESLRSLRTSLQFALVEARNNVVALTGPSPGLGKSFTVANLGHVLAEAGRRVLVVDADLRKGRLHRYFGLPRGPGLSEAICGGVSADASLRSTALPNLTVLTSGAVPPNPSELLASQRFAELVAELANRFDVVLIDTPPVLAVADPLLIGVTAGVNLMVLRAGRHSLREIRAAARRLTQNGVAVRAIVVNDVRPRLGKYGDGYYQYAYK